jgi:hypothetical protein
LSAAMTLLFALMAITALTAMAVTRFIFHLTRPLSIVIAIIIMTSAYFRHVAAAYELPVMVSMLTLMFLLSMMVRAYRDRVVSNPSVVAISCCHVLLFFTDMSTLGIALALQVLMIGVLGRTGVNVRRLLVSSTAALLIAAVTFADRVRWSLANLNSSTVVPATVLTMAIMVLAAACYLLRRDDIIGRLAKSQSDRRLTAAAIAYTAIVIVASNIAVHAAREPVLLRMPGKWRNLEQMKSLPFSELTLKIDYDPGGFLRAVTRYFLPDRRIHIIAPRTRVRDLPFETVSRQSPMLIQNFGCEGAGHADVVPIDGVGCALFAPPAFELDTLYPFNRTFLFKTVDGMTGRAGGRWNIGRRVRLKLMADPERTRTDRHLYVNISANPFLAPGAPPVRLRLKWGADRTGETTLAAEEWMSVPISAGDWNGNRVWTLPLSIDFFDSRTMLFQNLSVSEMPRGRLVQ